MRQTASKTSSFEKKRSQPATAAVSQSPVREQDQSSVLPPARRLGVDSNVQSRLAAVDLDQSSGASGDKNVSRFGQE